MSGARASAEPPAPPLPPPWEKRGNTTWVSCPGCEGWFPVDEAMLAPAAVASRCPHCGRAFAAAQAREVILP